MIKPVVLFIIGLACLIKGGDWFVDGASALARKFNLPELLIGATVVSPLCLLCPVTARSLTVTRSAP